MRGEPYELPPRARTLEGAPIKKAGAKKRTPHRSELRSETTSNFGRDCKKYLEGKDIGEAPPRAPCERGWGRRHPCCFGWVG